MGQKHTGPIKLWILTALNLCCPCWGRDCFRVRNVLSSHVHSGRARYYGFLHRSSPDIRTYVRLCLYVYSLQSPHTYTNQIKFRLLFSYLFVLNHILTDTEMNSSFQTFKRILYRADLPIFWGAKPRNFSGCACLVLFWIIYSYII